jgi:hypothetical protein
MGPKRTLQKTADVVYGRPSANPRYIETWSSKHDWVARANAWDDHERRERMKARAEARDKAREVFVSHAVKLARDLVRAAQTGDVHGAHVRALTEALDRAGVTVPKDVNVTIGTERSARLSELLEDIDTAEVDDLADLTEALTAGEIDIDD